VYLFLSVRAFSLPFLFISLARSSSFLIVIRVVVRLGWVVLGVSLPPLCFLPFVETVIISPFNMLVILTIISKVFLLTVEQFVSKNSNFKKSLFIQFFSVHCSRVGGRWLPVRGVVIFTHKCTLNW